MTVERLIEVLTSLAKRNPNAQVKLHGFAGDTVMFACSLAIDDGSIWLETYDDIQPKVQIEAIVKHYEGAGDSRESIVKRLLDTGFPQTDIDKYYPEATEYGWEEEKPPLIELLHEVKDLVNRYDSLGMTAAEEIRNLHKMGYSTDIIQKVFSGISSNRIAKIINDMDERTD